MMAVTLLGMSFSVDFLMLKLENIVIIIMNGSALADFSFISFCLCLESLLVLIFVILWHHVKQVFFLIVVGCYHVFVLM